VRLVLQIIVRDIMWEIFQDKIQQGVRVGNIPNEKSGQEMVKMGILGES